MPFRIKVSLIILAALVLLLLVGPFLAPVPPLEGTAPRHSLATAESRFATAAGVELHYLDVGEGPVTFLLLHGYPANLAGWEPVVRELSLYGRVVAFDRPGFGLSERPAGPWRRGQNPYLAHATVDQAFALLDELEVEAAIWMGGSTGGIAALQAALDRPERVTALVLEGAPVFSSKAPPAWLRPLLGTPQLDRLGPLLLRALGGEPGERLFASQWARPELIEVSDELAFRRTFAVDGWDRGLWEVSKASRAFGDQNELTSLAMPVLVLAGAGDPIVAPAESQRLAAEIPSATLALMEGCGHIPHRECPAEFMQVVSGWLQAAVPAGE